MMQLLLDLQLNWIGKIWPTRIVLYGHRDNLSPIPKTFDAVKKSITRAALKKCGFTNLINVRNMNNYMCLLDRDRIDLFGFTDFSVFAAAIRQGFDPNMLIPVLTLETSSALYIVASKRTDKLIIARLKDAYHKIVESDEYDRIMAPLRKFP